MAERIDAVAVDDRLLADRPGIIVTFTLLGGPVGGLITLIAFLIPSQIWATSGPDVIGTILLGLFFCPLIGFVIGLPPALLTGCVYALLPAPLQRIVVAPVLGFLLSASFALVVMGQAALVLALWYASIGAGAALVCAVITRKLGFDIQGGRAQLADEA